MTEQILALDMGFGWTKAMVQGEPPYVFLSAVGPAVEVRYEGGLGADGAGITVEVDGRRYFVGKRALQQSPGVRQTLDTVKVGDVDQKVQFYAAASRLVKTGAEEVIVITGLPVGDYDEGKKGVLRDLLMGEHVVRREGKWTRSFEVSKVHVLPQGMGALYALALDRRGRVASANRELLRGQVGVVDVGTNNSNFVLTEDLHFIDQGSTSISVGIGAALQGVAKDLKREYDLDWTQQLGRVDEAVRAGVVRVYGEPRDVSHVVKRHLRDVAEAIVRAAQSLPGWGSGAELSAVILTGGGSLLLGEYVREAFPHSRLSGDDPQTDNVTGYLRAGIRYFG